MSNSSLSCWESVEPALGSLYSSPWCGQCISHCSCSPPVLQGLYSVIAGHHGQSLIWWHCPSFTPNLWGEEWQEMLLLLKVRLFIARCSCCFQLMSQTGTVGNSLYSSLFVQIYLKLWVFGIGVHLSWFIFFHLSMRYKTFSFNIILLFNPFLPKKDFLKEQIEKKKNTQRNPKVKIHTHRTNEDTCLLT